MSSDNNQRELNDRVETILLAYHRNKLEAETFVNCDKIELPDRPLGPREHRWQTRHVDPSQEGS